MDSREYYEWLSKFEAKRTTDDCYTPPNIYDVVEEWVSKRYKLDKKNFVRPFIPNGDYKKVIYNKTDIVVDNPPFSILAEICKWYAKRNIKYFLFAPGLTTMVSVGSTKQTAVCTGVSITYKNGAKVNTSFVTNLEDEIIAMSAPDLTEKIKIEDKKNQKKKEIPKYIYNNNVVTAAMISYYSNKGIQFELKRKDSVFIRGIEAQKKAGKQIFGGGLLISDKAAADKAAADKAAADKAAADKAAADKAAAIIWELSEWEKEVIEGLGW